MSRTKLKRVRFPIPVSEIPDVMFLCSLRTQRRCNVRDNWRIAILICYDLNFVISGLCLLLVMRFPTIRLMERGMSSSALLSLGIEWCPEID